jgi:iron complex outermembrane receptor protein
MLASGAALLVMAAASAASAEEAAASAAKPAAGAQDAVVEEVVVTATRSAKAVDKIPGAVSVITEKEVTQQFQIADDPGAALAQMVPGYAPSRQKLSSAGESIRGRHALILLDSIPQGNPLRDGQREGYFIESDLVKRVEVVSGASAIYGLGATGGIINYITKSAEEGTHQQTFLRVGSQFDGDDNVDWKAGYLFTHKSDLFDIVAYAGYDKREMLYDARGALLGVVPSVGDTMDSHATNYFVKIGKDFGSQRIELAANKFDLRGEGNYIPVSGDALHFVPATSVRGSYPPGVVVPYNKIFSTDLSYSNSDFLGGSLSAQLFYHASDVLFGADTSTAFQDPHIAPVGTLYDQGLLFDRKKGGKLTYVRPDLFVQGLELTLGLDKIYDTTHQDMILTNRVWLTPLRYESTAPFVQLEVDRGPITIRGGLRYESGSLTVGDYTTLGFYGKTTNNFNGIFVTGGKRTFSRVVKNLGGVWRFGDGFSAYASYSEGFGLPDVGILLRSVTAKNQSVDKLVSLTPVVTEAEEVGVNLRRGWGSLGISVYNSYSPLGSTLRIGADGLGQVVRVPTRVRGVEGSADVHPIQDLTVSASFAVTDGKTAEDVGLPLNLDLGGRSQGPDKVTAAVEYAFTPDLRARLQTTHFFDRDVNQGRGTLSNGFYSLEEHFKGYSTVDFNTTMNTKFGVLGFSIENLLNQYYITYFSQVVRTSASDANKQFIAGRGRTFSLSLTSSF